MPRRLTLAALVLLFALLGACTVGGQSATPAPTTAPVTDTAPAEEPPETDTAPTTAPTIVPTEATGGATPTVQATSAPTAGMTPTVGTTAEPTAEATQAATGVPTTAPTGEATAEATGTVADGDAPELNSTYTSRASGVSFDVPEDWEVDLQVDTRGSSPVDQVGVRPPDDDSLVLLQVFRLNREIGPEDLSALKSELDRAFRTLARQNGGRLLSSRPYEEGDLRGYEYRYTYDTGTAAAEVRVFAVFKGDRQYNLQLEATPENQRRYGTLIERMAASLELPDEPPAEATEAPASGAPGRYESPEGLIAFDYPEDWELVAGTSGPGGSNNLENLTLRAPDGEAGMVVSVIQLTREIESPADFARARREVSQQLGAAVEAAGGRVVSTRAYREGDLRGFEYRLRFELQGQQFEGRQVHVFAGDKQYTVNLETRAGRQDQYRDAQEEVLSSFEIGQGE